MHVADIFEETADAIPGSVALIHGSRTRSWAEFENEAARLSNVLVTQGIQPLDRVAISLFNCSEYLVAMLAILKIRAVPVNVNFRYKSAEISYLLQDSEAKAVLFHSGLRGEFALARGRAPLVTTWIEVEDERPSDAPALDGALRYADVVAAADPHPRIRRDAADPWISYTGGTTGYPKGVVYEVGLMTADYVLYADAVLGVPVPTAPSRRESLARIRERGDVPRVLPACPLVHGTGLHYCANVALVAGGSVVTMPSMNFDPSALFDTAAREKVTAIGIVGDAFAKPMADFLARAAPDGTYPVPALRRLISAGAAFNAANKETILRHLPNLEIADGAGATEGNLGVTVYRRGDETGSADFRAWPGTSIVRQDLTHIPADSAEVGLVAMKTSAVRYLNDPERSAATFVEIEGDRFSIPGDWARWGPEHTIHLLGRGSSCINTGGEKVFPEEVEAVIRQLPAVRDCVVVGVPDQRFGESVTAVVAADSPCTGEEISAAVARTLAGYKAPRRVVFVPEIPRNPIGKPDIPATRALLEESSTR